MDTRDGWEITFWRSAFMTLFIAGVLIDRYRIGTIARIRAVGGPGVIASVLWAMMYVCFILALGHTAVVNVLVLASISPFATALLGRLLLHERVPGRTWLAMIAAGAGIVLMFVESVGGGLIGNLIALAIPFAFAVNVVIFRRAHAQVDMVPTLLLSGLISMAITLPLALPLEAGAKDLVLLAIMGVVQLGVGCLLMMQAAPLLSAAEIGLLAVLEIIFGTVSTWLVIGEEPARMALVGGAVVILSLVANEVWGLRQRARPEEDEAVREVSGAGH
jgi:drug/metabolite transporter (DMT)-like permease